MPDHFHFIVNPIDGDISKLLLRIRGNSARKILELIRSESSLLLRRLELRLPQKRNHKLALWQKDPSIVDLVTHKFLKQKCDYVHKNPTRAGLTDHPAKWRWSSYLSYLPHDVGAVPIEVDNRPIWSDQEIENYISAHC